MAQPIPSSCLDLRGTPCPLNLIRSRLALEALDPGAWLQLDLDGGEAEQSVAEGLRQAGHTVQPVDLGPPPAIGALSSAAAAVRLLVRRHGA